MYPIHKNYSVHINVQIFCGVCTLRSMLLSVLTDIELDVGLTYRYSC